MTVLNEDIGGEFLGERFEAKVPTLFEYLRFNYDVAEHQTLIVNGEDRTQEVACGRRIIDKHHTNHDGRGVGGIGFGPQARRAIVWSSSR